MIRLSKQQWLEEHEQETICIVISGELSGQSHTHTNHPIGNHPPSSVVPCSAWRQCASLPPPHSSGLMQRWSSWSLDLGDFCWSISMYAKARSTTVSWKWEGVHNIMHTSGPRGNFYQGMVGIEDPCKWRYWPVRPFLLGSILQHICTRDWRHTHICCSSGSPAPLWFLWRESRWTEAGYATSSCMCWMRIRYCDGRKKGGDMMEGGSKGGW